MKNEIKRTGTARKVGRPRAYTPEALEAKFEEYVEWVKANPVYINKVSAGEIYGYFRTIRLYQRPCRP